MKIIFSRKGYDSSAGGYASPIFPDKTLWSIPIPDNNNKASYRDLKFTYNNEPISSILNDFCNHSIVRAGKRSSCDYSNESNKCHHDPQLMNDSQRIVLGQADAADGHLRNHDVGEGDIFLFYGWFKEIEKNKTSNKWKYVRKTPDLHLIWAYMEVGDVLRLDTQKEKEEALNKYTFLQDHPHLEESFCHNSIKGHNSLYLSSAGKYLYFDKYDESKCLTNNRDNESNKRSEWRLPSFFNQPDAFTFLKEKNFKLDGNDVLINFSGFGQEFVLDLEKVSDITSRNNIADYIQKIING